MLVTINRLFQIGQTLVDSALLFGPVNLGFQIPNPCFQGIGLDFIGEIIFHGIHPGSNGRLGVVIAFHHIGIEVCNPIVQATGGGIAVSVNQVVRIVHPADKGAALGTAVNHFIHPVNPVRQGSRFFRKNRCQAQKGNSRCQYCFLYHNITLRHTLILLHQSPQKRLLPVHD